MASPSFDCGEGRSSQKQYISHCRKALMLRSMGGMNSSCQETFRKSRIAEERTPLGLSHVTKRGGRARFRAFLFHPVADVGRGAGLHLPDAKLRGAGGTGVAPEQTLAGRRHGGPLHFTAGEKKRGRKSTWKRALLDVALPREQRRAKRTWKKLPGCGHTSGEPINSKNWLRGLRPEKLSFNRTS